MYEIIVKETTSRIKRYFSMQTPEVLPFGILIHDCINIDVIPDCMDLEEAIKNRTLQDVIINASSFSKVTTTEMQ